MPERSDIQALLDPSLTTLSIEHVDAEEVLIADIIAPPVEVATETGKYPVIDRSAMRIASSKWRPGADVKRVDWGLSKDTFSCDGHKLAKQVTWAERIELQKLGMDADAQATAILTSMLKRGKESEVAATIASAYVDTVNSITLAGNDKWSDYDHSNPIKAITERKSSILSASQVKPNTLIIPDATWEIVKEHPKVTERIKGGVAMITPQIFADLVGVKNILIPSGQYLTSKKGQTETTGYIWTDTILCYISPAPKLRMITLALTFQWVTAQGTINGYGVYVEADAAGREADIISVKRHYDQKIVDSGCMFAFISAT